MANWYATHNIVLLALNRFDCDYIVHCPQDVSALILTAIKNPNSVSSITAYELFAIEQNFELIDFDLVYLILKSWSYYGLQEVEASLRTQTFQHKNHLFIDLSTM